MMEEYYTYKNLEAGKLSKLPPDGLKFGGSFWNFTADDYATSAVNLY
jgi:hypothetical protein